MNIEILKCSLILINMGQYNSNLVLEFDAHQWNRQDAPNAWTKYPPKNEEYYKGKRFFKISRGFYPQFTKGYLWGRYENPDYYKEIGYVKDSSGNWVLEERERVF